MIYILLFIVGIIVGLFLSIFLLNIRCLGFLRIDNSDPEENPYLFLEMKSNLNRIKNKKYVIFKVKIKNYISQK